MGEMVEISHFSGSHFPPFSKSAASRPRVPGARKTHCTHRREEWEFRWSPTPTTAAAEANALGALPVHDARSTPSATQEFQ